jgi:hypothetical protein
VATHVVSTMPPPLEGDGSASARRCAGGRRRPKFRDFTVALVVPEADGFEDN